MTSGCISFDYHPAVMFLDIATKDADDQTKIVKDKVETSIHITYMYVSPE